MLFQGMQMVQERIVRGATRVDQHDQDKTCATCGDLLDNKPVIKNTMMVFYRCCKSRAVVDTFLTPEGF